MNNPARPITNQSINLKGIKVTIITAMKIINMCNKKSSFMNNMLAQSLKELKKRD